MEEFEQSNVRRFKRALAEAKRQFQLLPIARQEQLLSEFQAVTDEALKHLQFRRGKLP